MTSSATERELEKGELNTAIPALPAARRSTWFVPMQKHPITRSCHVSEVERSRKRTEGHSAMTLAVILVLDRTPTA